MNSQNLIANQGNIQSQIAQSGTNKSYFKTNKARKGILSCMHLSHSFYFFGKLANPYSESLTSHFNFQAVTIKFQYSQFQFSKHSRNHSANMHAHKRLVGNGICMSNWESVQYDVGICSDKVRLSKVS